MRRLPLLWNASCAFVWGSSCLEDLSLGGDKYLVILQFDCSATLSVWMMLLDCVLLCLLEGACLSLVYSICFSPFLRRSFSGSQTWMWLWYCLNARKNLAVTCGWDIIPAAGVTCAETGSSWQWLWGQREVTPVLKTSPREPLSFCRVLCELPGNL